MNIDTVRAAIRGQLRAIAVVDTVIAQSVEDAIAAGIEVAFGAVPPVTHELTEDEVLANQPDLEAANAAKREADIKADPTLGVEAPLDVPAEIEPEVVVEPETAAEPPVEPEVVAPVEPTVQTEAKPEE